MIGRLPILRTLVLAASLAVAGSAWAGGEFQAHFQAGVGLYKEMDFERALEQFRLARALPHGAAEDVRVSLYEGILLFELGQEEQAAGAFRAAVSVDPHAALPVAVSPRIQIAFDKERAKTGGGAPAPPAFVPLPQQGARPEAKRPPPARAVAPAKPEGKSYLLPSLLTAGGVVVGGLGGGLLGVAWAVHDKYERGEATRKQAQSGDTTAKVSVPLMAVGGAALVAGVVLFALPAPGPTKLGVAPLPGGGYASVTLDLP